jgi:hypothetical protein
MRKGLALKLAVMTAALGAMTLLQGCDGEEDSSAIGSAWTPAGFPWTLFNYAGFGGTTTASGQGGAASSSGGASVASAISSAGGGNQVSSAGAQ